MLRCIELNTGYQDDGPAWIGRIEVSRSGRTVYFNERAHEGCSWGRWELLRPEDQGDLLGFGDRARPPGSSLGGSGKVLIEAAAVDEYLSRVGESALDSSRFMVTNEICETDPADVVGIENEPLEESLPNQPLALTAANPRGASAALRRVVSEVVRAAAAWRPCVGGG